MALSADTDIHPVKLFHEFTWPGRTSSTMKMTRASLQIAPWGTVFRTAVLDYAVTH